jgi:hypothetical protein
MRIYMAGVYHGGRASQGTSSIHLRVSKKYEYPWILESFHYADPSMLRAIRENKQTIFLDSGAFTMFMQGVKVDLKQYARFIFGNQDIIHIASNLDAIGEGHEQESYDRQKLLEQYLGDKKDQVKPVHHVRDRDDWLQRYLDEGCDYIFIGGMVPESTKDLLLWLDHVWHKYLTNADGTPKVKVHGFGLTTTDLMFRYPWYSVDSTRWVMESRFGGLLMDFPQPDGSIRDINIDFSERSPQRYRIKSWHFWSLTPDEQEVILARLAELEAERIKDPEVEAAFETELGCKMGYNPEALGKSYGLRDIGNMEYFRRAMDRRIDRFTRPQDTLF